MIKNVGNNPNNINAYSNNINMNNKVESPSLTKEFLNHNNLSEAQIGEFVNKIQEQIKDAQIISIKIVRGESLTKEELKLINEKYPDLKELAHQSKSDLDELKTLLKNCKSESQRQEIISKFINDISKMNKKGLISDVHYKVKMSVAEEAVKFLKNLDKELNKAQLIATKIFKGETPTKEELKFISQKYPEIKNIVNEAKKELNNLKNLLKNCKNEVEREAVLSKFTKDINNTLKDANLPKLEKNIKTLIKEEVIKFNNLEKKEIAKSVLIATKMIKEQQVSKNELSFINDRYPDIKLIVEENIKDIKHIKQDIVNCQSEDDKNNIVSNMLKDINNLFDKGLLSEFEYQIKLLYIEDLYKDDKKDKEEKNMSIFMNPYINIGSQGLIGIVIIIVVLSVLFIF